MFEAFNRDGIEAALPFMSQDVVWHSFPEWPGAEKYEGWDGVRQLALEWTENFDEYRWDVDEVHERAGGILVLAHHHGRSVGAGMPISQRVGGWFTTFDDEDRTGEAWFFVSWEEARELADARAVD